MPHYKDGTEAKVGDRVRGVGYNAELHGYDPNYGIEGVVTHVRPGDKCTLTVAYLTSCPIVSDPYGDGLARSVGATVVADGRPMRIELEYGDTVGFQKVG